MCPLNINNIYLFLNKKIQLKLINQETRSLGELKKIEVMSLILNRSF
jgi:hypothetical protein